MKINKLITVSLMAILTTTALAAVSITDVSAKQRYPWNGLVDIGFTLQGVDSTPCAVTIMAIDCIGGTNLTVSSLMYNGIQQTGNPISLSSGTHNVVWNSSKDLPNGYVSDKVVVTVSATKTNGKYMVVDLSNGKISYLNSAPSEGWNTSTYKTTKMVLQRVEAGTYKQFLKGAYGRLVTITRPFYMSIMPLTKGQLGALNGSTTSDSNWATFSGSAYFSGSEYYARVLRGNDNWPHGGRTVTSSSPIGKLRQMTGNNNFDLPTAGVLGLAAKSMSLSQGGTCCLDWHTYDWGESPVTDPMGPLSGDSGNVYNGSGFRISLDSSGNNPTSLFGSDTKATVRICLYDAE